MNKNKYIIKSRGKYGYPMSAISVMFALYTFYLFDTYNIESTIIGLSMGILMYSSAVWLFYGDTDDFSPRPSFYVSLGVIFMNISSIQ